MTTDGHPDAAGTGKEACCAAAAAERANARAEIDRLSAEVARLTALYDSREAEVIENKRDRGAGEQRIEYGLECDRPSEQGSEHPSSASMTYGGSITRTVATHYRELQVGPWTRMPAEAATRKTARKHGPHCYPWDWQYGDNEPRCEHRRSVATDGSSPTAQNES